MKRIFFVGIGGIGVSAMAGMALQRGFKVSGSDIAENEIVKILREKGVSILIGQSIYLIPKNTELVVYSNALKKLAPDFLKELDSKFKILSYPEYVAEVTRGMYTIAVAGTHGKTTTTGMIAKILLDASFDPTIIIGSIMKDVGSNFVSGKSKYLILEADEYQKAFLNYWPDVLVITNISEDHLEYYGSLSNIQNAFRELTQHVKARGYIVCNPNDPKVSPILENIKGNVVDYTKADLTGLALKLPGEHNRANAKAALEVAGILGISRTATLRALNGFAGTWRRFELKGTTPQGALVYDDYAHNPEKIRAALAGAREMYPEKQIVAVFQPHLYSRTKLQFGDFLKSFNNADEVIVLPIFASREASDRTISSELFVQELGKTHKGVCFAENFDIALELISQKNSDNVIVLLGAGDIYKLSEQLLENVLTI